MQGKHRFVPNPAGFREVLRRDSTQQLVLGYGQAIAAAMGDGYTADAQAGRNRAQIHVKPATAAAEVDNRRNNTLLKGSNAGAPQ